MSGSSQVDSRRCGVAFLEVLGGQGKSRVLERLPESYGRGLDDDFQVEAFSCHVWSFSVLLGPFQVVPGGVQLRRRRSQEVRGD